MGLQRLEQLINEYRRIRIEVIHRTQTEVTFDNGDLWKVVPADDRSRGQACNVGLIERGTPEDVIHTRIMPCIKNYPYRAYNYY